MKDLPTLYAAVCAKRPELAVPNVMRLDDYWMLLDGNSQWELYESQAAALILAKWVEALPDGSHLMVRGNIPSERRWTVYPSFPELDYYPTPLEAIAAFYLGETQ